jgi:hypothetical protein
MDYLDEVAEKIQGAIKILYKPKLTPEDIAMVISSDVREAIILALGEEVEPKDLYEAFEKTTDPQYGNQQQ